MDVIWLLCNAIQRSLCKNAEYELLIPTYLRRIYIGLVDSKNSGTRLHGSMMGQSNRTSIMKDIKSLTSSNRIIPLNVLVAWILQ